jgi:hypothetical protein
MIKKAEEDERERIRLEKEMYDDKTKEIVREKIKALETFMNQQLEEREKALQTKLEAMEKPKKNNYLIIFANNKFFLEKLKI